MNYYSTEGRSAPASCREAVLRGLAPDGGLYLPEAIPRLAEDTLFGESDDHAVLAALARPFFEGEVPPAELDALIRGAVSFEAPLVELDKSTLVLELFHGPTCAFKDFGARFMARLMSYFCRNEDTDKTVLVATSGDTGSAVAHGFFGVEGVQVVVLYPSGKVSPLQEKQLTILGGNITALEIEGTFDDCQRLVKQAFLDPELQNRKGLTSANSINIARLLPQSFYYVLAARYLRRMRGGTLPRLWFSVPSGNFGNLTGGLIAERMGLPVERFIAATNSNNVFVDYLQTGVFSPRPSVRTISNAMDVGSPSNFARIAALFRGSLEAARKAIAGASFDDDQTRSAIREAAQRYDYLLDPHGAVGYLGLRQCLPQAFEGAGVLLATAHPAKFLEIMEEVTPGRVELPERLSAALCGRKQAELLPADFSSLKERLLT